MNKLIVQSFVLGSAFWFASTAALAASEDTKRDKVTEDEIKQDKVILVAKQFLKGIEDNDVDQLMKLADVPWLGIDEKVFKDRKVLEKDLREFLEKTDVRQA